MATAQSTESKGIPRAKQRLNGRHAHNGIWLQASHKKRTKDDRTLFIKSLFLLRDVGT